MSSNSDTKKQTSLLHFTSMIASNSFNLFKAMGPDSLAKTLRCVDLYGYFYPEANSLAQDQSDQANSSQSEDSDETKVEKTYKAALGAFIANLGSFLSTAWKWAIRAISLALKLVASIAHEAVCLIGGIFFGALAISVIIPEAVIRGASHALVYAGNTVGSVVEHMFGSEKSFFGKESHSLDQNIDSNQNSSILDNNAHLLFLGSEEKTDFSSDNNLAIPTDSGDDKSSNDVEGTTTPKKKNSYYVNKLTDHNRFSPQY